MPKSSATFELQVGAIDKFSGPFKGFGQAVDEAGAKVSKFGKTMGLAQLGGAFKGLGGAIGKVKSEAVGLVKTVGLLGAGAAAGILGLAKSFSDTGDEAAKMAERAGITAQAWQEMAHAANMSGASTEELLGAYTRLGKASVEAAKGGKNQAAAFRELGVSLTTAEGKLKNTDLLMMDVAEALSRLPEGAQKSAMAMEFFGKSGARLLPFLNEGREGLTALRKEAGDFGLVMDNEALAAAGRFDDTLDGLKARGKGLSLMVGGALLPLAQGLVESVNELVDENRGLIKTKVAEWAVKIKDILPKLKKGLRDVASGALGLARRADDLAQKIGGWGNVAKVAAGIMARPLVNSILGLIGPLKTLGLALVSTPVGIVVALGAAFVGLMAEAGVLEPFLAGVSAGFAGMSAGLTEAFVSLLEAVGGLFGDAAGGLRDINGEMNPEAWRELGEAVGEFAGGSLKTLVEFLAKAVGLFDSFGKGLGLMAGYIVGGDVDKMEAELQRSTAAYAKINNMKAQGADPALIRDMIQAEMKYSNNEMYKAQHPIESIFFSPPKELTSGGGKVKGPGGALGALMLPGELIGRHVNRVAEGLESALAPSSKPFSGPSALAPGAKPLVQETKHTEVKESKVAITVTAPPGTTVDNANPADNVKVETRASRIGTANH